MIRKRKKYFSLMLFSLLLSVFISYICHCENSLKITNYTVTTDKINGSVKIAFISDLHNKEFGSDNINLVNAISEEKPDIIALGGDMISSTDTQHDVVITLLNQLTKIAPTYYIWGNHERTYVNFNQLEKDIKNTDAVLLDNEMERISVNGDTLTIGGLTDFPYYEFYAPDYENEDRYFLDAFRQQQSENFSILLAHQPEFYFWNPKEMELDLILSGHTHGGVIQIPCIGGLYAPNQGFFPEYDKGYFSTDTAQIVITSGLGNTVPLPRLNNEPEICMVNICPK